MRAGATPSLSEYALLMFATLRNTTRVHTHRFPAPIEFLLARWQDQAGMQLPPCQNVYIYNTARPLTVTHAKHEIDCLEHVNTCSNKGGLFRQNMTDRPNLNSICSATLTQRRCLLCCLSCAFVHGRACTLVSGRVH